MKSCVLTPCVPIPQLLAAARPCASTVRNGTPPPSADRISFFGISIPEYDDKYKTYGHGNMELVLKGPDTYDFGGFGFVIFDNIHGKINGSGFSFCSRIFLHDRTSGITVDSHLPVRTTDLPIFERDFAALMKHLSLRGMNTSTTSAHLLYGISNDPRNHLQADGLRIATILHRFGFVSCTCEAAFDLLADYEMPLQGEVVLTTHHEWRYLEQLRHQRKELHEFMDTLANLSTRSNQPILTTAICAILKTLNDLLPAHRRPDIDLADMDGGRPETPSELRRHIARLRNEETLAHIAEDWLLDEWRELVADYI